MENTLNPLNLRKRKASENEGEKKVPPSDPAPGCSSWDTQSVMSGVSRRSNLPEKAAAPSSDPAPGCSSWDTQSVMSGVSRRSNLPEKAAAVIGATTIPETTPHAGRSLAGTLTPSGHRTPSSSIADGPSMQHRRRSSLLGDVLEVDEDLPDEEVGDPTAAWVAAGGGPQNDLVLEDAQNYNRSVCESIFSLIATVALIVAIGYIWDFIFG